VTRSVLSLALGVRVPALLTRSLAVCLMPADDGK
jgi:hypothetical protein